MVKDGKGIERAWGSGGAATGVTHGWGRGVMVLAQESCEKKMGVVDRKTAAAERKWLRVQGAVKIS